MLPVVLVDTSVWVDHFRTGNYQLARLLELGLVKTHPLVIGEIACGTPPNRSNTLADLHTLEQTLQSSMSETLSFIDSEHLYGSGCGLIDLLLLTSTLMTPGTRIWTLDKRLKTLAERFDITYQPIHD